MQKRELQAAQLGGQAWPIPNRTTSIRIIIIIIVADMQGNTISQLPSGGVRPLLPGSLGRTPVVIMRGCFSFSEA